MTSEPGRTRPVDLEALAREYDALAAAAAADHGEGRCPTCGEATLRVGTDVQAVASVLEAVHRHGARYLARVFTPAEVDDSLGGDEVWSAVSAASLAGRYAAKEAVIKVLRPVQTGLRWSDVEVVRQSGGWCTLTLSGAAGQWAARAGLSAWSLSFAHDGPFAVATVVARHECSGAPFSCGTSAGGDHGQDHP